MIEIRRGAASPASCYPPQQNGGTRLFDAIDTVNRDGLRPAHRDHRRAGFPANADLVRAAASARRTCPESKGLGYMINVASNRNGVGYGRWCHIDGFSEQVLRFIAEHEASAISQ